LEEVPGLSWGAGLPWHPIQHHYRLGMHLCPFLLEASALSGTTHRGFLGSAQLPGTLKSLTHCVPRNCFGCHGGDVFLQLIYGESSTKNGCWDIYGWPRYIHLIGPSNVFETHIECHLILSNYPTGECRSSYFWDYARKGILGYHVRYFSGPITYRNLQEYHLAWLVDKHV